MEVLIIDGLLEPATTEGENDMNWNPIQLIDGYILRSSDVQGRAVRDLPRILGLHPDYLKSGGAIYGLRHYDPNIASAISIVGFNNDRDPENHESFVRPPLMAGLGNQFRGSNPQLLAELSLLYQHHMGMLIKFKFAAIGQQMQSIAARFPIGAGIREYILHRPAPFHLIWTFSELDMNQRIP